MIDKYTELFKDRYPNGKIKFVDSGQQNVVFELDGDYILRAPKKIRKNNYRSEIEVLSYIRDDFKDFKIPDMLLAEHNNIPYTVHKKLQGDACSYEQFLSFNRYQQKNFIESFVYFARRMHEFIEAEMPACAYIKYQSWPIISYDFMADFLDCYLSSDDIIRLHNDYEECSERHFKEYDSICFVLLHGNLSFDNVLLEKNKTITAIYDFEDAKFGEVELEFVPLFRQETMWLLKKILTEYRNQTNIMLNLRRIAELTIADCVPELIYAIKDVKPGSNDYAQVKQVLHRIKYAQGFIHNR